jgi:uncharacterized protein YqfB (UPF0267 family)
MASVKITYELPEEQEQFYCSINGSKWKNIVLKTIENINSLKENYESDVFDNILYNIYSNIGEEGLSV